MRGKAIRKHPHLFSLTVHPFHGPPSPGHSRVPPSPRIEACSPLISLAPFFAPVLPHPHDRRSCCCRCRCRWQALRLENERLKAQVSAGADGSGPAGGGLQPSQQSRGTSISSRWAPAARGRAGWREPLWPEEGKGRPALTHERRAPAFRFRRRTWRSFGRACCFFLALSWLAGVAAQFAPHRLAA